ncbi:MAG: hypothetical protein ACUZ8I_03730 [Candidatus Scalindua sp.]
MHVGNIHHPQIGTQNKPNVNAAGNSSNKSKTNGTAPVAQFVNKVDSVILSQGSLALSRAENASKTSNGSTTQNGENNALQRKTEEKAEINVQSTLKPIISTQNKTKINAVGDFSRTNGNASVVQAVVDNVDSVIISEKSIALSRAKDASKTEKTEKKEEKVEKKETEKAVVVKKKIKSEIRAIDNSLKLKEKEIDKIDRNLKQQSVNGTIESATQKVENNAPQRKTEEGTEKIMADIKKKMIKSQILAIDKSLKLKEKEVEKIDRNLKQQSVNVLI